MVTESELACYERDGYCLIRNLIPQAQIAAAAARVYETVDEPPSWADRSWQCIDPSRYRAAAGHAVPGGIQRPALEEQVFADVAEHPNLVAAMSALLQHDVEMFTDQIGVKQGFIREEQGGRSYFHQDSYYWHIAPELGCNCWIPLQDVGADAIALAVMPGSQRGWQLIEHESYYDDPPMGRRDADGVFQPFKRHRIPLDQPAPTAELLVPMSAGDGLFFTNYTWHRSEPNRTGQRMAFYAIAYQRRPA